MRPKTQNIISIYHVVYRWQSWLLSICCLLRIDFWVSPQDTEQNVDPSSYYWLNYFYLYLFILRFLTCSMKYGAWMKKTEKIIFQHVFFHSPDWLVVLQSFRTARKQINKKCLSKENSTSPIKNHSRWQNDDVTPRVSVSVLTLMMASVWM